MKKIKFAIASTLIIVFIAAIFSFAAEVKSTLPTTTALPAAPAAMSKQTQQPIVPPAASAAPAPTSTATQGQQTPPLSSTSDNYSYNPVEKPDPFQPPVEAVKPQDIEVKKQILQKAESSMFPLQRAETERYRVVGIAGNQDHRVAIAEDAAKKFYPLFVGTHIGIYDGRVIAILADRVVVEEYENKKAKRVILKLRKN